MKIKKTFQYAGVDIRIVERDEPYMNSGNVTVTRVIAPNGGTIPVKLQHKQTLKSIMSETIVLLDGFKKNGADVVTELIREIIL